MCRRASLHSPAEPSLKAALEKPRLKDYVDARDIHCWFAEKKIYYRIKPSERVMEYMRRVTYFPHQVLTNNDFREDQNYHIAMRRLQNRFLYTAGVVAGGLWVERRAEREILITPGLAIDSEGREIVLLDQADHQIKLSEPGARVYVGVKYHEVYAEYTDAGDADAGGTAGYTRLIELMQVIVGNWPPPEDASLVLLASVRFDDRGAIQEIDNAVRKEVGIRRSPELRPCGWVSMPFSPHPVDDERLSKPPFLLGATEARAGAQGAAGAMGIPLLAGALYLRGFRIAGEWNYGELTFDLLLSGWDPDKRRLVNKSLLRTTLTGDARREDVGDGRKVNPYEQSFLLSEKLDPGYNALAVSVECSAEAAISLIAVRFEHELQNDFK
jgi:hypothetical protein